MNLSMGATNAFRLCISCVAGFALPLSFGNEGVWLAMMFAVLGIPFILFFVFISMKHPESIKRYPIRWAAAAIFLAAAVGFVIFGQAGFALSLIVSFPSALIFILWNLGAPIPAEND